MKLSLVMRAILESSLSSTLQGAALPHSRVLSSWRSSLIDALTVRFTILPFSFIAISFRRYHPAQTLSFSINKLSLIQETFRVEDDRFSRSTTDCWSSNKGALGPNDHSAAIYIGTITPFFGVKIFHPREFAKEVCI